MNRYNLFDEQAREVFGESSYEKYSQDSSFYSNYTNIELNETKEVKESKEPAEMANIKRIADNMQGDGCVDQCAKLALARAYVRVQDFAKYYEPMESLAKGTAFPELHNIYTRKTMGRAY